MCVRWKPSVGHDVGVEELQRMRMHVAVVMQHRTLSLTMAAVKMVQVRKWLV